MTSCSFLSLALATLMYAQLIVIFFHLLPEAALHWVVHWSPALKTSLGPGLDGSAALPDEEPPLLLLLPPLEPLLLDLCLRTNA